MARPSRQSRPRQPYNGNSQAEHLEYPNGVTTTWIYDSQSRLEDLITRDPVGQILQSYHCTMAKTSHRTQIDEHDGTVRAYDYDDLWRLTQDKVTRFFWNACDLLARWLVVQIAGTSGGNSASLFCGWDA